LLNLVGVLTTRVPTGVVTNIIERPWIVLLIVDGEVDKTMRRSPHTVEIVLGVELRP
jgi:hypothetical protein